ncbi:MAG TPA: GNAT family N-acetyltransferase [Acidiphilium sp.]|nr:GNAT family N-acetyltransferase [Acidiphilium sp.]
MTPTITMSDKSDPDVRAAIGAPLFSFNVARSGSDDNFCHLVLTLTLPGATEIIGGLWGHTGWDYLHIEYLVVPEAIRGSGIGRELMRQAEDEAVRRGCHRAWLDTFSFQARGFYERLGYTVFGMLEDFPPGHSRFFLKKLLIPATVQQA